MKQTKLYASGGRLLVGLGCLATGIGYMVNTAHWSTAIPTFMGAPHFWTILLGVIWCVVGLSFLINQCTRATGILLGAVVVITLMFSTYRGFDDPGKFGYMVVVVNGYFAVLGGAMMIASEKQQEKVMKITFPQSLDLFYGGRILLGVFFFSVGWLHFVNMKGDAALLGDMPGAVFWVVFIGIAWFAVALSFWTNIMARTAAVLASVVVLMITFMISIHSGSVMEVVKSCVSNAILIGGCMLVASRGHYMLHVKSWWCPPMKWGLNPQIKQLEEHVENRIKTGILHKS